jgi:hypothetical protein
MDPVPLPRTAGQGESRREDIPETLSQSIGARRWPLVTYLQAASTIHEDWPAHADWAARRRQTAHVVHIPSIDPKTGRVVKP